VGPATGRTTLPRADAPLAHAAVGPASPLPPGLSVRSRTTWAVSLGRKYYGTGTLPYECPISRPAQRP